MFKCCYYLCFKCNLPYFGGMNVCANAMEEEKKNAEEPPKEFKPEDLVCPGCAAIQLGAGKAKCDTHGTEYIDYKCKFCCSIACWFCWGTTHFCEPCHRRAGSNQVVPCKGPGKCDLGEALQNHPANGTVEYALGCSICRSTAAKTF